jgi:cyclase
MPLTASEAPESARLEKKPPVLLRIIPCLLLHQGGLVKTKRFKDPIYVGDPINAVKIFSDKCADELIIIDIDATAEGREPKVDFLRDICSQAFMPVCYGGGVKSLQQMERLFHAGIEKISLSSAALQTPSLLREASSAFGSQSVVVTIDIRRPIFGKGYAVSSHRGKKKWPIPLADWVKGVVDQGAGEIVINDIDRDGTMSGYDYKLVSEVVKIASVPVVALGGAKDVNDMEHLIEETGVAAAAAGSVFVFIGPHRAVLIHYPEREF